MTSRIPSTLRALTIAALLAALATAARADVLAHWSFDELTGPDHDTLLDSSGHLNSENSKKNATASDKSQLSLNVASDVPFGKALTFTGKPGSYLDVPYISSIHQHSFTVAVWVYLNKPDRNYVLADWSAPMNMAYAFGFDVAKGSTTPRITAYMKSDVVKTSSKNKNQKYNVDVLKFTPAAANTLSLNAWHHVAWVWDRQDKNTGTLTIYLDGANVQSANVAKGSTTDLLNNHREVRVGLKQDTNSTFNGSMDELWVFGDALTPDQITNLMKTNDINTPPTQVAAATPNATPLASTPTPITPATPTPITPATPAPIVPASPTLAATPTPATPTNTTPAPITPTTPSTPEPLAAAAPTIPPPSITPSTPSTPAKPDTVQPTLRRHPHLHPHRPHRCRHPASLHPRAHPRHPHLRHPRPLLLQLPRLGHPRTRPHPQSPLTVYTPPMNTVLIGYRGTGKSSIGKHLAATLHMDFADADLLLVQRAGKTIKELFETEGEPAFRDRESAILQELAMRQNTLIAAGGGAVLREQNRTALRNAAIVIWLQADPATLHARIAADQATAATRPNLTSSGGIAEVRTLLATRTPLYQATTHLTLDVSILSIESAATELARLVHDHVGHYGTRPYNPQNP